MSFSTQPPEILDMILNQMGIPLWERIHLRAVSPQFRDILQDGFQRETSLTILTEFNYHSHHLEPKSDDLIIKKGSFNTKKCAQFIGRLFPQVTQLTMYSDSIVFWRKASELIGIYSDQLQALKVDGFVTSTKNQETVMTALGEAVNSIVTLTSLDLDFNATSSNVWSLLLPRLEATLSRLDRFICTGDIARIRQFIYDHNAILLPSLSHACTHLRLDNQDFDELNGPFFAQLASNLTHLHLMHCYNNNYYQTQPVLSDISELHRLSNLTLHFKYKYNASQHYTVFDSTILQQLRPPPSLTELHLLNIMVSCPLEPPPSKASALSHIKRLTMQIVAGNFDGARLPHALSNWFPGLSEFTLYCNRMSHQEIQTNLDGIPFTVKLLDEPIGSLRKFSFWQ